MERLRITCAKKITIGDKTLIAPDVFITDHNHGMNPEQGAYYQQPLIIDSVSVGKECWIGQRVCILPGVIIGDHCIIGAGSIVTKSIPDYSIAAGVPAKVIKRWDFDNKRWKSV